MIAEGEQDSSEEITHNPNAFIPFSFGPANCVGKNFAMTEMKIFICRLVQQVEFSVAPGYKPDDSERDIQDMFVVKKGKLPAVVRSRNPKVG